MLVLTIRVRFGTRGMESSHQVADALEGVAQRFRASGYVETCQSNPGGSIDRSVVDYKGDEVGEWSLTESPV